MENVIIELKKIPNGTDDIAKYLGLEPSKTLFIHSTSFNESDKDNIKRRAINKGRMIFAEPLSYSSSNENGAKTVIAYFNDDLLKKLDEIGIIKYKNVLMVSDVKSVDYPNNCVSSLLNQKVKNDSNFRESIKGNTIVSCYLSKEDEETANLIDGKILMDRKLQEKFNSKYDFRLMADKYGFSVADGVCVKGLNELEEKLKLLDRKNNDINNLWIKLEAQSSGTGNIKIKNYKQISNEDIKQKINDVASKIFDKEYIDNEMQFIIEADINLGGFEEVANLGVEAVIADGRVSVLGGVDQKTENGKYLGSKIDESTDEYMKEAVECAIEAFKAVSIEGYRGFMTIDVLVTKNTNTGEIRCFNIDPNARFSAGTMLLKNIHTSEAHNNRKMYGISFANAIPKTDNTIQTMFDLLGDDLYNYHKDYTGIIPTLINDLNEIRNNRFYLKTVVVDFSYNKVEQKYTNFVNRIKEYIKRNEG